jgi:hypothetical protein
MSVLDESDAFFGRRDERVANHFKDFWSFEKTKEIAIVDGGFRIEVDSKFFGLMCSFFQSVGFTFSDI